MGFFRKNNLKSEVSSLNNDNICPVVQYVFYFLMILFEEEAMKKHLALVLCLLMLVQALSACSDGTSQDTGADTSQSKNNESGITETENAESEKVTAESTLTIVNFNGRDYRMISTNQDERHVDICADEFTGAALNDLVHSRNLRVSELYNVNMVAEDESYSVINDMVRKDFTSGDLSYELYLTNYTAHSLATAGCLYNFYNLPYVNLTQEWWDQHEVADMTIQGNLFLAIGDISPTELLTSECMLFNKNLFDRSGIEYPYKDALDGKWTLDKVLAICDGRTTDLNGDGEIKVGDDLFSLTCWSDYPAAMLYGAGGDFSHTDENGSIVLDIDVEKSSAIYDKIYALLKGTQANYEIEQHERSFKVFNDGRAYFCGITFQKIEKFLREMEDDYGVLPNPKFDENQENYSTCVSGAGSMVVIPRSCSDVEFVGAMTEAMAALSYDMITPDLIDVLASTKNVRDTESSQIVQLIIRNRNFDTARMHNVSVDGFVEQLLRADSVEISSYFAMNEKVWSTGLKQLNKKYEKLNSADTEAAG